MSQLVTKKQLLLLPQTGNDLKCHQKIPSFVATQLFQFVGFVAANTTDVSLKIPGFVTTNTAGSSQMRRQKYWLLSFGLEHVCCCWMVILIMLT